MVIDPERDPERETGTAWVSLARALGDGRRAGAAAASGGASNPIASRHSGAPSPAAR